MSDHTLIESEEHAGHTVELHYDEDPMSPREWDNLTKIFSWETSWTLGEEKIDLDYYGGSAEEVRKQLVKDYSPLYIVALGFADYGSSGADLWWDEEIKTTRNLAGFALVTEARRAELGVPANHVEQTAKSEIETYGAYVRGEVYGYVVKDRLGEVVDSCWGYIGEKADALAEGRSAAEALNETRTEVLATPIAGTCVSCGSPAVAS